MTHNAEVTGRAGLPEIFHRSGPVGPVYHRRFMMDDDRTYGETLDCRGCRNWSEMLARAGGGSIGVEAMCLAPEGPKATKRLKYTSGRMTCGAWASGELGAIDDLTQDPTRYSACAERG